MPEQMATGYQATFTPIVQLCQAKKLLYVSSAVGDCSMAGRYTTLPKRPCEVRQTPQREQIEVKQRLEASNGSDPSGSAQGVAARLPAWKPLANMAVPPANRSRKQAEIEANTENTQPGCEVQSKLLAYKTAQMEPAQQGEQLLHLALRGAWLHTKPSGFAGAFLCLSRHKRHPDGGSPPLFRGRFFQDHHVKPGKKWHSAGEDKQRARRRHAILAWEFEQEELEEAAGL